MLGGRVREGTRPRPQLPSRLYRERRLRVLNSNTSILARRSLPESGKFELGEGSRSDAAFAIQPDK